MLGDFFALWGKIEKKIGKKVKINGKD